MARRRCLGYAECRSFTDGAPWCPAHKRARKARRNADADLAAAAVAEHRRRFGDWCPGWQRPGHPASDLTADHPDGIHTGGAGRVGDVLCRSCNARKGPAHASTQEGHHPEAIERRSPPRPGLW